MIAFNKPVNHLLHIYIHLDKGLLNMRLCMHECLKKVLTHVLSRIPFENELKI